MTEAKRYRARILTIEQMLADLPVAEGRAVKNSPRELLKQGYVDAKILDAFNERWHHNLSHVPDEPLTFQELTSYSTWFTIHPEKIAGKEVVSTSLHFPIYIDGTREDIERAVRDSTKQVTSNKSTHAMKLRLKLKAKAVQAKLKNKTLNGCGCQLGALPDELDMLLKENNEALREVLEKSRTMNGLGSVAKTLSFDQVVKQYNQGITDEEIKAWVWYKRNQGEPMRGWDKFFDVTDRQLDQMVKRGVLFYNDGELLPYPIYAFGNMYDRTLQLEADKEKILTTWGDKAYEAHTKVIAEVKPRPLSVLDPDKRNRPKILAISRFAKDFTVENLREDYGMYLSENEKDFSIRSWFKYYLKYLQEHQPKTFREVSASEIWNYYVKADNLPRGTSDAQKEIIAQFAPLDGEELFSRFLHEALTIEDQQKLDMFWNRTYNGWSSVPYHRIPVGFESSAIFKHAPLEISPIQREGIAFMKAVGSGIIAFDVGVGKTMTAIVTLANELYSGKCKRPVIVCPNGVYEKWKREIFGYTDDKSGKFVSGVLSGTDVGLNDWYNLGTAVLKDINLEQAVKPNTITMLTYEGFAKLGFGQKVMDGLFEELKTILVQAEDNDTKSQRDIEKQYQVYRDLIGVGNKGSICDIETVGFDYIVIDEAHNFKNVFSYVPTDDEGVKRFKIQSSDSARGKKAFFICNYIQRTFGSNVMLLTATPFTNNPIEVFSMLSLVGYDNLRKMGVYNLYSFMETFILQSLEYVNSYDGTIQQKHVVKAFNNRLILQKLIYNHINYKTGEEAGVKRPCKINLPKLTTTNQAGQVVKLPRQEQLATYLSMTDRQANYQKAIIHLAQSGHSTTERMRNVMRALAGSLDNALSPFIYDKTTPESAEEFVKESPKIYYVMTCIASVKKYHEENLHEPVSGQMIYMNRGKEYFKYIKQYLEEQVGYKTGLAFNKSKVDEVEIITSEVSQDDREFIKDAFLEGVCKIIIGTATIREGIDLQRKGTVLYNCYPDWNPTDVKQLEGRIWRQGNMFGYVRVVMPLVQDSMDVFVFQKLEEKTSRVNDIWYRADRGNVLDVEALDPEEVKFALYTDLEELAKVVIDRDLRELRRSLDANEENASAIKSLDHSLRQVETYRGQVVNYILSAKGVLQNFMSIVESSPARWEGITPAQLDEYAERALEIAHEIEVFETSIPQEDKTLIRLSNRLRHSIYRTKHLISFSDFSFENFKTYYAMIEKARRSVMEPKGYTMETDFGKIVEELNQERAELAKRYEYFSGVDHKMDVIQEIKAKKALNKVEGLPAEEASADFQKLNYLLQYKFNPNSEDTCIIPEPNEQPKPKDKKHILRLRLALKAKAVKVKLKIAA